MAETKAGHVLVAQVPAGTGAASRNGVPRMLELGLALSVQGSARPSEDQLPTSAVPAGWASWGSGHPRERDFVSFLLMGPSGPRPASVIFDKRRCQPGTSDSPSW